MDRCKMGKFVAIVKLEVPDVGSVAKELCQHIVGMNPKELGEWQPTPVDEKELKKKKKKKVDIQTESKDKTDPVEEKRLYDQEFLIDQSFTVRTYLHDNGPKVVDFVRIECGEDLGEDD